MFAPEYLINDQGSYTIYLEDHGSYHKLLHSKFFGYFKSRLTIPQYLSKDVPKTKICEYIQDQIYKIFVTPEMLDL